MARLVRYEKEEHHSSNPIRLRKPELVEKIKEILEKELEVELGKEKVEKLKDFIKELEKKEEKVVQPTSAGETDLWLSKQQALKEMKERGTPIMLIPATYNPDRKARTLQGDFYISGYSWIGYGTISEILDFLPEGLDVSIRLRSGEIIKVE